MSEDRKVKDKLHTSPPEYVTDVELDKEPRNWSIPDYNEISDANVQLRNRISILEGQCKITDSAYNRLHTLIYILIRDYVPVGTINFIIKDHVSKIAEGIVPEFTDPAIGEYCGKIAEKILDEK